MTSSVRFADATGKQLHHNYYMWAWCCQVWLTRACWRHTFKIFFSAFLPSLHRDRFSHLLPEHPLLIVISCLLSISSLLHVRSLGKTKSFYSLYIKNTFFVLSAKLLHLHTVYFYLYFVSTFSQRMLCLSYTRWVLWEGCQPENRFFSVLTGLSHSGLSSLSGTALVWSRQTSEPMLQFWKS